MRIGPSRVAAVMLALGAVLSPDAGSVIPDAGGGQIPKFKYPIPNQLAKKQCPIGLLGGIRCLIQWALGAGPSD